jgi:hypothetical protein
MTGWVWGIGWPLVTLVTGRQVYGLIRAHEIKERGVESFKLDDRAWLGATATMLGLLWPFVLCWLVVTAKPRKTERELREQVKARDRWIEEQAQATQARIAELERELRIGDHR